MEIEIAKEHMRSVLSKKILDRTKLRDRVADSLLTRWNVDIVNVNSTGARPKSK
jgi:hypothetical protein